MSAAVALDEESAAISAIRLWRKDPVRFVRDQFHAEPDAWQLEALQSVARDPRLAMSACKGPGKSCLLAWVIWWFLATNVDAQVMAVSITAANLKDNLWKELALWQAKSPLLQATFDFDTGRIKSKERPDTWWVSARSFPKAADATQQANTLAGFHGQNILVVLDEVGDYPHGVVAAAEAIFANDVNAKLVVAGNPTDVTGPLHSIVSNPKGWRTIFITGDPDDPKRSPRISADWARAEIAKHGRDNPWVMVNIIGLFPPAGSKQLISANIVTQALARDVPALSYLPDARIWGLDPARFGDDEIALARRQGVLARRIVSWRNLDGTQLGDRVAHMINEAEKSGELPDAIFVDVGGVGASCYDRLRYLGYDDVVHAVDFGGAAIQRDRYANKRTEMWCAMADWLNSVPACLPTDPVLQAELQGPEYDFRTVNKQTVYILESKQDMKDRGVPSPNRADALALTFAAPVASRSREARSRDAGRSHHAKTDYDPLERA